MIVNKALIGFPSTYSKLLSHFPQNIALCFAYGSGVMKQAGQSGGKKNMVDLVFAVEDANNWHKQNMEWNPSHYSSLRWLGHGFVANFQENWGAKIYFNTLITMPDSDTMIKYGVVSRSDLVTDLLDWNYLYVAGRLHKPVEIVRQTTNSQLQAAIHQNLHSAVHAALLLLPESFSETELYHCIAGLSYSGDFRMMFGEDKNKVDNIVAPQVGAFRDLYGGVLKSLQDYVEMPATPEAQMCAQDISPEAKIFHLNQLPKVPQRKVVKLWNKDRGSRRHDTEESLYALAYDPECGNVVQNVLQQIVFASSVRQSVKGILTAGLVKSVRYSSKKVVKMMKSEKMTNFIGPSLPPHLTRAVSSEDDDCSNGSLDDIGPQMPHLSRVTSAPHSENSTDEMIGPLLPPHLRRETEDSEASNGEIGPPLPESLQQSENRNERSIGPSLPPKMRTKLKARLPKESGSSDEEPSMIGPSLPPHLQDSNSEDSFNDPSVEISVIGPTLPLFLRGKGQKESSVVGNSENLPNSSTVGPSLPAFLKAKLEDESPTVVEDEMALEKPVGPVIGPTIPAHLKLDSSSEDEGAGDDEAMYGPALPPGLKPKTVVVKRTPKREEDSENDEVMGPLPEGTESDVQKRLEVRAQHLRLAMDAGESSEAAPKKRESWMLELPENRAPELGLKPRQFRRREGPEAGDRSVWTDTPEDRERKKRNPKAVSPDRGLLERQAMQERDEMMDKIAEKHSGKRGSRSLVEMHQEKLQAKKKKEEKDGKREERRPFSREVDLQANRFDEAQKKSIMKKAHHLNDRFSAGASKFL